MRVSETGAGDGTHQLRVGPVTVFLLVRSRMLRAALATQIKSSDRCRVVGESDRVDALEDLRGAAPGVIVFEHSGPVPPVKGTASGIRERVPGAKQVLVSGVSSSRVAVEALDAGVDGYITSHAPLTMVVEAITAVSAGEIFVSADFHAALLEALVRRRRAEHASALDTLTTREREVLLLIAAGASNREIAEKLCISPHTARTHVQNVLAKLGLASRLEAAAYAISMGL